MNKDEIRMKCQRCGSQHRVLDMVMDANKRGMLCRPCAGLQPEKGAKLQRSLRAEQNERRRYQCADCSYRFSSSKPVPTCGYCGSTNIRSEKQNSAQSLIFESGQRRFET